MTPIAPDGASVPQVKRILDSLEQRLRAFSLAAVFLILLLLGCKSAPPTPSNRLASVLVRAQPMAHIEEVVQEVFKENGFASAKHSPGEYIFEKAGSNMNTLVYGDWSEKKVWVRVKFFYHRLGSSPQILLECDVYMINEHGDAHFEEEHKLTKMHRGKYQELLEKIAKRLP